MKMIRSEAKTAGGFFRHLPLTAGGFFRHLPLTAGGFFRLLPLTAGGFFRHLPLTVGGFFRHLPLSASGFFRHLPLSVGGLFCASSGSSTSAFLALALAVLGVPADGMSFTLDKNVPAGNIALDRIEGDTVYVHQELRDTSGDWFYWAFRVTGAQGRTLDFRFTKSVAVGTRGPCVSLDLGQTWNYAAENGATRTSFRYTFPTNATEVWFYETIPYLQTDWEAFLARHAADRGTVFETGVLCQSRKGRNVEKAVFGNLSGNPKHRIFLSARRHCSETMASFVMEGILESVFAQDETGAWYRANVEIMAVPFMDKDGCEEGDQGKNRQPHDHNRDYTDFLYPETRGIRDWIAERADNKLDIFFDFHCPWLYGNYNEFVYQVHGKQAENTAKMIAFGKIVEALQTGSMAYREADDLRWGVSWNSDANYTAGRAVKMWALEELSCGFVSEFEIPFATANGMVVTRESCREFGRDTARAFRRFLEEVQTPLEGPDIWYQVSSAPDRFWTTTNGWVTGSGTPLQRLPSFRDRVTMNSSQTGPDNPLIIPAGQEAVCGTLYLASIAGTANNYAADGRIPTLQLHGGTLSTPSNTWDLTAVTVGRAKGGYGLLKIESGSLVTNTCLAVGYEGIGEVRNNGGSLHFGTSGTRNLTLGTRASGTGRYVQESGSFIGSMHLSQNGGTGTVEIAGGTVKGNVYAGCGEIGLGTLSLRGGSVTGDLTIGQLGRGIWEMSGGSYSGTPVIGKSGTGEFRFRGGTVSIPNLTLGESASGIGRLDADSSTLLKVTGTLHCGYDGMGEITLRSVVQQAWLKIGGNVNRRSEMSVLAGGTNLVTSSIQLGGYLIPVSGGTAEKPGKGTLTLRGGTLRFTDNATSSVNFHIGRCATGWGCLRGYGKVAPASPGVTNVRLGGGNCVFRADGDGEERDLDLHEVVNITNYFATANITTATNGWYAENKGRVLYPRTWFGTTTADRCFGDAPYASTPRFVNGVRFSINGVSGSNNFFRGGLYATDRADIPAGLPRGHDIIGVWNFGLFNHVNNNNKVSFSTISLTFRYDHTKVRDTQVLTLYRYTGTEWVQVGQTMPNAEYLISTTAPVAPLNATMNVGFFAIVARSDRSLISIR